MNRKSISENKKHVAGMVTRRLAIGASILAAAFSGASFAQTDASSAPASGSSQQPLRIIVGIAPGGVPDIMARIIAQQITVDTGRVVLVENRVGAGGIVALNTLTNAPADGNAIVFVESGSYAIAPHLTKLNPYADNVVPVAFIADAPFYLCVNSSIGVNNVKEFMSFLKTKHGASYGSSGNGSTHHLAMEYMKAQAGSDIQHIPYKGAGQTVVSLMSNEVSAAFLGYTVAQPQVEAGKIKILAVASAKRNPLTPNIPSVEEAGGPPLDVRITIGTFASSKTPPAILASLNRQLSKAASSAPVRAKFAQMGVAAADGTATAGQYAAMVKEDFERYGKMVRDLNLKIE